VGEVAACRRHDYRGGARECRRCGRAKDPRGRRPRAEVRPLERRAPERAEPPDLSGELRAERPRPMLKLVSPPLADEADAAALANALASPQALVSPPPSLAPPAPPPEPSWCAWVGQAAAGWIVRGCAMSMRGELPPLEAGPADPKKVERIGQILRERLALWFPDTALPWWGELVALVGAVYVGMRATARKLPPKESKAEPSPAFTAATAA